jgi:glycyl-tRNA synthetase
MTDSNTTLEDIARLCKQRGFLFQGSEIYGGLAGTWDYGPLGVALKNNIKASWWWRFVQTRDDMHGLDAAVLMNPRVWEASGHLQNFNDPLVEDTVTGKRFRADHLLEEHGIDVEGMSEAALDAAIRENNITSPEGNELSSVRLFNMMFQTQVSAAAGNEGTTYLRPETAQGIFVNFKNVLDTQRPKLPFGIAQIGKAFRNEISPREFLFRTREFEQLEIEYFVRPEQWEESFEHLRTQVWEWLRELGLNDSVVREHDIPQEELAFYSRRTIDFEYEYPGKGFDELLGLAYRTDYDLSQHAKYSGADVTYKDEQDSEAFIPHVIEPSFGLDRLVLAVLANAYTRDEMGEKPRTYLKLPPALAPYSVAVFPLLKNKPQLVEAADALYRELKATFGTVAFDDNGNIGKRYRRQDEIGTPLCITVDFDTLEDGSVTLRDRDTGAQERIAQNDLYDELKRRLSFSA